MTGEGVNIMECTGSGELFVADLASEIQVMYLENDQISVNGNNVLAFSSSIEWEIHRVQARGAAMTGGVSMDVRADTGGVTSMLRGDTGELLQMASGGQATCWSSRARTSSRVSRSSRSRAAAGVGWAACSGAEGSARHPSVNSYSTSSIASASRT